MKYIKITAWTGKTYKLALDKSQQELLRFLRSAQLIVSDATFETTGDLTEYLSAVEIMKEGNEK